MTPDTAPPIRWEHEMPTIANALKDGATFQLLATRYNVSREWIRLVTRKYLHLTGSDLMPHRQSIRHASRLAPEVAEALALLRDQGWPLTPRPLGARLSVREYCLGSTQRLCIHSIGKQQRSRRPRGLTHQGYRVWRACTCATDYVVLAGHGTPYLFPRRVLPTAKTTCLYLRIDGVPSSRKTKHEWEQYRPPWPHWPGDAHTHGS